MAESTPSVDLVQAACPFVPWKPTIQAPTPGQPLPICPPPVPTLQPQRGRMVASMLSAGSTASVSILWKPTTPKRTLGLPSQACLQHVTRLQPQQAPMVESTPLEDIPKAEISTPWKPTIRAPTPGLLSQACLPC